MRAVVTRVDSASVAIGGKVKSSIGKGFLIMLGVHEDDEEKEALKIADKICGLRIFEDEAGKMNKSLADVGGGMMVVSNFTLYADCAKGRRPDFFHAAKPNISIPVYESFIRSLRELGVEPVTGRFGADMQIDHINDGPVTLIMDTDQMMKY